MNIEQNIAITFPNQLFTFNAHIWARRGVAAVGASSQRLLTATSSGSESC